ncbi:tRNA preQ1(34) S-adenosylmethionine ribosyltransferase-isomerase QueA [Pedosphaera parvula]|uniref:S-adenosylmethionine:tRNA ribosyltransferase-isomerase n=1 Tax=Pedosphaera parvula (strain Ellin514) TaxID=320771 RepID=B9XIH7_PEDPL|nr:tRNA preQ1(34) S-adenosylmethionine ribosyltransferase-isomerase QueA [Pedosphaera parvula]EEF60438.1 S-adenosylmethionine/tRNA-ribosyltransferase-isomerase [Pedosphaera parvula Ellin514]
MRTSDFDFALPPELIAQAPTATRDQSRLLVLKRNTAEIAHRKFRDVLEFLKPGDVLVLNNSRVIPARLRALNARTNGQFEVLLLEEHATNDWWVMMRPGKRARIGTELVFRDKTGVVAHIRASVIDTNPEGHRRIHFTGTPNIIENLDALGEIPLPPYIERNSDKGLAEDDIRYQTVYAKPAGSVAAPTAGLHFTDELLHEIRSRGIQICFVTLHVGLGTFAPVKAETLSEHVMHEERYELSAETAQTITTAKHAGRRIIAVGTTSVRVLESVAAQHHGKLIAGKGRTRIFIHPPYSFSVVDVLLTNFHLPCSTLLMLVSAFAAPGEMRGREIVLAAYAEAVREKYRFFSYGDAMLVI